MRSVTDSRSQLVPGPQAESAFSSGAFLLPESVAPGTTPGPRRAVEFGVSPLQKAWVQFLQPYPWQWFATFTFAAAIHPEAADKKFRYWLRLLNEQNVGPSWRRPNKAKQCAQWVRGLEWQKRDVLHYHALIGNVPPFAGRVVRDHWCDVWRFLDHAGFAFIKPIADTGGVVGYIAKYVSKGGEIDVSRNLPQFHPELSAGHG